MGSSFSLPLAVPPLPAPTLSPVKSARREQLLLLIISSPRKALLSKGLSLRLLSAHSWMMFAACEANVDMWFPDMAGCIYNHFVLEGDVCSRLGLCKKAAIFTPR